jgi:uncharacterized protein (TIGR02302 family)
MSQEPGSPIPAAPSGEKDLAQLHLGRKLWLARLALAWERAWPALWPALGIGGTFVALGLFDVLPVLPAWLHGVVLVAFAAGVVYALWRGLRAFRFPGVPPARRRIETVSGYAHRPLTLAADDLAGGRDDPKARALWQIHRERVLARIRALRIGLPAPGLARLDPLALRGALIVVLAIGTVVAWGDGLNRIARALSPGVGFTKGPAVVDVWITPPAYTGMAPIFLSAGKDDPARKNLVLAGTDATGPAIGGPAAAAAPVVVPEGSTVLSQLSGGWGTPKLVAGGFEAEFKPVADGTWKATAVVAPGTSARNLAVRQGTGEVASWPVTIRPDAIPAIRFADEPGTSSRGAVRIEIEGEDDYGFHGARLYLSRARVELDTDDEGEEAALEKFNASRVIDLPLPGSSVKAIKETSYHDLTADPWAGMEVTIQVVARDGADQPAVTDPVVITLPERYFRHPVARALVMLRKRLIFDPESRSDVWNDLVNLGTIPGAFNNDTVVFLALQTMAHRLDADESIAAVDDVQKVMWETALRIEDGQLSLAEKRMRELQKKLMEALNRKDNAEIQKLMQELEKVMAEFLKEMMKDMKDMPQMAQPFDPNSTTMSAQDLQRMLDRARELAMTGNLDAARQMLSMLRELLENLKNGRFAQRPQGDQQGMQMLRDLQDMMKRQQELMDETHRRSQDGSRDGQQQDQQGAQQQGELQKQLQDLLRRFGEMQGKVPKSLGDAELAMREALRELEQGKPGQAVPPQGRALEEMQRGAGELMQQMMRQYGQGRGRGPGRGFGGRQQFGALPRLLDPLGRPLPNAGNSASDDVEIPDESDTQRAREILEELRRRAGELGRPLVEMEYLERLLRRF